MFKKICICLVLLFGTLVFVPIHADDKNDSNNDISERTTAETVSEIDAEISLESMSNEELESLCTSRGFELVKELDQSGVEGEITREDYIDAARQCLEIESEMEKILEEHPHLLDEIEAEAAIMKSENETLHLKLKEMQDDMETENEKAGEKFKAAFINNDDEIDDDNTNNSDDEGKIENENENGDSKNGDDDVVDSTTNINGERDKDKEQISGNNDAKTEFYGNDSDEVIDLDECADESITQKSKDENEDKNRNETVDDVSNKTENVDASDDSNSTGGRNEEGTEEETVERGKEDSLSRKESETLKNDNNTVSNDSTIDAAQLSVKERGGTNSTDSMLTLKDFAIEFRNQIKQDISSVGRIIFPVPYREPALKFCRSCLVVVKDCANSICDMVKRYGSTLFHELFRSSSAAAQNDSSDQNATESNALVA